MDKPKPSSLQEKKFSKEIQNLQHLPSSRTINIIDSRLFSLDGNTLFRYKPEFLAAEEYKRCLSLFERRLPEEYTLPTPEAHYTVVQKVQAYESAMFVKEMRNYDELKEIAVDTIRDLFDIPEHVQLLPNIGLNLELPEEDQEEVSLTAAEKSSMRDEIQKRVILNALVHGGAMHIWKSSHYIVKDKIEAIDPTLMMLYDQYTAAVSWSIWQVPVDSFMQAIENGSAMNQGFNELEFEEEGQPECSISCSGVNFPVLLHEVAKGALDYLICNGIPQDYTEDQLRYYYQKADAYENEIWHYLMSPTVWIKLVEALELPTQDMPMVIARLTQLSYQELSGLLKSCLDNKSEAQVKLKSLRIV
jgi:hypothetical protein